MMTNDERDQAIRQTAGDVSDIKADIRVFKDTIGRHDDSLYNPQYGHAPRLQRVEDAQASCPAKVAAELQTKTKTARISNIIQWGLMIVTAVGVILTAVAILTQMKGG